jgi:iron complex outermembrane receptor protein
MSGAVRALVGASLLLIPVSVPRAQEPPPGQAPPQAPAAQRRAGLEQITVTARKVEENLQTTPVAVTAFTGAELEGHGVVEIADISLQTPSLRWEDVPSGGVSPTITLRGIQQTNPLITADGSVAVYLDEVYTGRLTGMNQQLVDIERLEVLKGPQGTLYGRNAVGGAININSRRPTGEWGGYGKVGFGNYNLRQYEGALGFPILGETLAGRAVFQSYVRDGWHERKPWRGGVSNTVAVPLGPATTAFAPARNFPIRATQQDFTSADASRLYGRLSLRWRPTDTLDILAVGYNVHERDHAKSPEVLALSYRAVNAAAGANFGSGRIGNLLQGFDERFTDDPRKNSVNVPDYDRVDARGASLIATYDLTESVQLKSVTGTRGLTTRSQKDSDGTPVRAFETQGQTKASQFSQEFQLNAAIGERFTVVSGLYWFNEDVTTRGFNDLTLPVAAPDPAFALFGTSGSHSKGEAQAWSVYGHGTYNFTERLSGELGLRTTYERRQMEINNRAFRSHSPEEYFFNPNPLVRFAGVKPGGLSGIPTTCDPEDRFDAVSWHLGVNHQTTDDLLLYAKASKGFRSGAYNNGASDIRDCDPVEDEFATTYEVGFKSEWLDNRLRANFAAYATKHRDIQLTTIKPDPVSNQVPTLFFNDRLANITGLELELTSSPFDGMTLMGAISTTWHRFHGGELDPQIAPQAFMDPEDPTLTAALVSYGRQVVQNTPALKFSLTARYDTPEVTMDLWNAPLSFSFQADYAYQSETDASSINHPKTKAQAYGIVNGRIAMLLPQQNLEVALWGKNLLDREYFYSGIWYRAFNIVTRTYSAPRQFGVEITYRFGSDAG